MDHPSEETLKRFAAGTASREEGRAIVAHLVKGCADCARKLKSLMEPSPSSGRIYDDALELACFATASAALRAASGSPR
jgi:hypothetical protein